MNKLNKVGLELLEYKKEYLKDYPLLIVNSLAISLDQMVKAEIIDRNSVDLIKNKDITEGKFMEYLLDSSRYAKSEEELEKEMEDALEEFKKLVKTDSFDIKTSVKEELYIFVKKLSIDVEYIKEYFGLDDSELSTIMDKKGFAEKFAALRMKKVLIEIINELTESGIRDLMHSSPYFNVDGNGFDIDLIKRFDMGELLDNKESNAEELKRIDEESLSKFNIKMQI